MRMLVGLGLLGACGRGDDAVPAPTPTVDVAQHPPLLFQVFGDATDPRVVPVATIAGGKLDRIIVPVSALHALDSAYFSAGTRYPIFRDGMSAGMLTIRRPMWLPDSEPLYTLPGCKDVMPMGAATLDATVPIESAVEFLATSAPPASRAPVTLPSAAEALRRGRALALEAAKAEGLEAVDLDSLFFYAKWIATRPGKPASLYAVFLDQNGGDIGAGQGHSSSVMVIADDTGAGYQLTYRSIHSGEVKSVEYRRLLNQLDVDGDGIDELVAEAWRFGSSSDLVILGWRTGAWRELLRVPQRWCATPEKPAKR
ncbi:MAG: hypothetical protein K2X99_07050 [Gemmatimonadaceae bacterium]|nr:hypothetical protein [Gemmatimonadaceae bacterium]